MQYYPDENNPIDPNTISEDSENYESAISMGEVYKIHSNLPIGVYPLSRLFDSNVTSGYATGGGDDARILFTISAAERLTPSLKIWFEIPLPINLYKIRFHNNNAIKKFRLKTASSLTDETGTEIIPETYDAWMSEDVWTEIFTSPITNGVPLTSTNKIFLLEVTQYHDTRVYLQLKQVQFVSQDATINFGATDGNLNSADVNTILGVYDGRFAANIGSNVTSIGDSAFKYNNYYQYVFIQSQSSRQLHFEEIHIYDNNNVLISQNGNWVTDYTNKTITTNDGDSFYFSASFEPCNATRGWEPNHIVDGVITQTSNSATTSGAIGHGTAQRSYVSDCTNDGRISHLPFVVFKFSEPKNIGKIVIHSVRASAYNWADQWASGTYAETSNHDIFLTNDITDVTMPSGYGYATYVPTEIPIINGSNYKSILHATSGVEWIGYRIPNSSYQNKKKTYVLNSKLTSITIPNSVTSIGNSAFQGTSNLFSCTLPTNITAIPNNCFYNSGLKTIDIPDSVVSIGDYAFSASSYVEHKYQYVFIEVAGNSIKMRLDLAEIEIWDTDGIKISQNGTANWISGTGGAMYSTDNTVNFYFSESYHAHSNSAWNPINLVDGNIPTTDDSVTQGFIGVENGTRSYQKNLFERNIENGLYIPYCVFQFNEPKSIGKIEIHSRRFQYYNHLTSYTSNHNIYLANEDSVNEATNTNNLNPTYVTPTIPYINGSNYQLISHREAEESGIFWQDSPNYPSLSDDYRYSKVYDFSAGVPMQTSGIIPQGNLTECTFTGTGLTTIGEGSFKNSGLTAITLPNTVTQIGGSAFYETNLETIDIPKSVTTIGDYAFGNCIKLLTAEIHRYVDDVVGTEVSVGKNIFNNCNTSFTVTIHSDDNWVNTKFQDVFYRYVFYERYNVHSSLYAAITEFEVFDNVDTRISHDLTPSILYSSRINNTTYKETNINDGLLIHNSNEWHSDYNRPAVFDVFGSTSGTYKREFIGYDFGSPQDINKIILHACSGGSSHENYLAGDGNDRAANYNGYRLFFTNNIKCVSHYKSGNYDYTPMSYTCVDHDKPYSFITSNDATFANLTNDTYTHDNISLSLTNISYKYNILSGTTSIATDGFKNKNLSSVTLPNTVTTIGDSAFFGTGLSMVTIPDSVISIGDYAFSVGIKYQYVFIEMVGTATNMWLGIDEIEIWDTQGKRISQNGNWAFDENTGAMTTMNGDVFYYTEAYTANDANDWHARRMLNDKMGPNNKEYFGIIGYPGTNRSYIKNLFTSTTNDYVWNDLTNRIPYGVIKFNEPKDIGKIVVHCMRRDAYNNSTGSTSNHNIYLTNEDSVTMATMPVGFTTSNYVTPTIPYISGSNYKSITHATSGVSWGSTAPESSGSGFRYDKTYDFTTTPLAFMMNGSIQNQNQIESITITGSSNLQTIGEGCLQNTKISSITLPSSLTTIGASALKGTNLSAITLPTSLTTIGASAFSGLGMSSISLPSSLQSIGDYAFANCSNLSTAEIHRYTNDNTNNPITAGSGIFNNMRSMDITIHSNSNWTDIAPGYRYVFYERDLTTKAEVACISEFEVWDNNGIRISHITGNDAPEILWSTKVYTTTDDSHSYVNINNRQYDQTHEWYSKCNYDEGGASQSVYDVFGNSSGTYKKPFIGYDFKSSKCINKIVLSQCEDHNSHEHYLAGNSTDRSSNINGYKLYFTNDIITVTNTATESTYITPGYAPSSFTCVDPTKNYAVITSYDYANTYSFIKSTINGTYTHDNLCNNSYNYTILNGTTAIATDEFKNNKDLVSVTLPSTITTIGDSAFEGTDLTTISLPSSLTTIEESAFKSTRISSVTIPDNVTTIGASAFSDIYSLTSYNLPGNANCQITSIPNNCFYNSSLTAITIPETITSIGDYAYSMTTQKYQYVFFEAISQRLDLCEIEIFDTDGNKISQNGNWTFDDSDGTCTAPNVDFYYSESYHPHTYTWNDTAPSPDYSATNWHSHHVLENTIKHINDGHSQAIIGNNGATRSYRRNCFESSIETGDDIPYCVFKFNEPKNIGKIVVHCWRHSSFNYGVGTAYSSNHNIYLANNDSVSTASNTNSFNPTYVTPTIPYISGSNYNSILHTTSGVDWGTTAPESYGTPPASPYRYDKTYDFTTTPLAFTMNGSIQNDIQTITLSGSSGLETMGEGCLQNTKISSIAFSISGPLITIGASALKGTNISAITLPSTLTTIGASAFYGLGMSSISLPSSIQSIGDYAFGDCPNLATAEIHRYTGDNTNNPITVGKNIFNNSGVPLTVTIHTDKAWNGTKNNGFEYPIFTDNFYRYVIYERDYTTNVHQSTDSNAVINEFTVYDPTDTRISHNLSTSIIWSSRWNGTTTDPVSNYPSGGWDFTHINDKPDNASYPYASNHWHARATSPSITDVFGNTSGTYKKAFIGYDFGSIQEINSVELISSHDSVYRNRIAGTYIEGIHNVNGYKIYFTNDVININTTDNTIYTPVMYTCINPNKPYYVIDSNKYTNPDHDSLSMYDIYNHTKSNILKDNVFYDYQILDGTTAILEDDFKDNKRLVSITIPDSVTTIGDSAFSGINLSSISLPSSLTTIGASAFSGTVLSSVTLPNTVTTIGASAFSDMHNLTSFGLSTNASFTAIPNNCFTSSGLSTIDIPAYVTSIGDNAFSGSNKTDKYQYVFIQCITRQFRVGEIEIWDTDGNKISENGNWVTTWYNYQYGSHTIYHSNGSRIYWSGAHTALGSSSSPGSYHPHNIVKGGTITISGSANNVDNAAVIGTSSIREYVTDCTNNGRPDTLPFVVFKFHERKSIGKIKFWSEFSTYNSTTYATESSNHDIFLTNDIFMADFYDNKIGLTGSYYTNGLDAYAPYDVPIINGPYQEILHRQNDNVSWEGTSPIYSKTYDFSATSGQSGYFDMNGTTKRAFNNITYTGTTQLQTIGSSAFKETGISSFTIPDTVETIGASAFNGLELSTITLPSSLTTIGDYAFGNCPLSTAEIHSYTGDVISVSNEVNIGNEIFNFNQLGVSFGLTVHSDRNFNNTLIGTGYQYVFFERDLTTKIADGGIAIFEVWNKDGTRISHTLDPTVIWSSYWDGSGGYNPDHIKNDSTTHAVHEWHSDYIEQSIKDVFGNTTGLYTKTFIGYDFGSPQNINKIRLTACSSTHDILISGNGNDRDNKINGYKLYFTNDVHAKVTTDSASKTPGTYTCVDPNKPYAVITSYDEGCVYVNTTNDTYTHDNLSSSISTYYNIISGTTEILANDFKNDEYLSSVTLPSSLTTIGTEAFNGTTNLTTITLPNSVNTIGTRAFYGTTNLTSCTLPNNSLFTTIPDMCFWQSGLTSIAIPAGVTTLNHAAFYQNYALTSCTFNSGSNLTNIEANCFYNTNFSTIEIPDKVTYIGNNAFNTTLLTSIAIPDSVTSLGTNVFANCYNLTSFTLPNNPSFTAIPTGTFKNSMKWTGIQVIPYSVTDISDNAFTSDNAAINTHLAEQGTYLKLPIALKDDVNSQSITKYAPDLDLLLDHFGPYQFINSLPLLVKYEGYTDLSFADYKVNGTSLGNFRKGILVDASYCDYETTNITTLNTAFTATPYAVAGPIGYQMNGGDIGKRIAPYYKQYTTSTNVKLFPGWTKFGILAIGGGGGGQGGYAQGGGGARGGAGGGAGGMAFGYFTSGNIDMQWSSGDELEIIIGAGGTGGAQRTTNGGGPQGTAGGDTTVKYNKWGGMGVVWKKIVEGSGGGYGHGADNGGTNNETGGIGSKGGSIGGTFITNISGDSDGDGDAQVSGQAWAYSGGAGGSLADGSNYSIFNFTELTDWGYGAGHGGAGGRGDTSGDFGLGGTAGDAGSVYIFQYF